jgi:phage-related protein
MAAKKNIVGEFKSFNADLEKYLGGVDFDAVKESLPEDRDGSVTELVLSSLIDLRTELALLRKNLTVDITASLVDDFSKTQKKYQDSMSEYYNKFVMDLKQNFSSYIEQISGDLTKLKAEFTDLKKEFNRSDISIEDMKSFMQEVREDVSDFDIKVKNIENAIHKKMSSFDNQLAANEELIKFSTKKILANISSENKSLHNEIESMVPKIESLSNSHYNSQQLLQDLKKEHQEKIRLFKDDIGGEETEEPENYLNVNTNVPDINLDMPTRTAKIIDIDSKLKKLSELR